MRRPLLRRDDQLADEAFRLLGRVDVVFSNAGIVVAGPIAQMTHDDWRWVIDIDLWGSIHTVEAFLPRLLEQGSGGHVAFTASFAGLMPNVGLGAYSVAKYGVVGLAENLAREVKDNGIGVSVLCPMVVETKLLSNSERIMGADYGLASAGAPAQPDTLNVDEVARLTVDAIAANRLYVLPHSAARRSIRSGSIASTERSTSRPTKAGATDQPEPMSVHRVAARRPMPGT